MAKFVVYLEPAEEGGYVVSCPQLPGCVTQGETAKEALEMIKDAIQGYIASLQKHGEPIPPSLEEGIERAEVISV
jgi:predicted RNase H-like HicB family nuclease